MARDQSTYVRGQKSLFSLILARNIVMTDALLGVVGTLGGTVIGAILGFGGTWFKDWLDERKGVNIDVVSSSVELQKINGEQGAIKFYIKIVIQNKSTIAQPIWGLSLKFGSILHPMFNQPGSNVSIFCSPTITRPVESEPLDIEPKKIQYIVFEWEERLYLDHLDAYTMNDCIANYNTFNGLKSFKLNTPFVVKEVKSLSEITE
ncbi:hypothetical protein SAMN05518672_108198 [Chitinophaga sp. CF118]|uniref:hypothetical protein n=1 Tax=Chitinophaga sp. CF118 TaxID=1884367 RepID=UPI0008E5E68C|nr:hypothetical protein [Chitinophaga sp. CF118]SFE63856.1 hypothetical protein SAMN05518672_108198 [Chitinophaga sp. CF118]